MSFFADSIRSRWLAKHAFLSRIGNPPRLREIHGLLANARPLVAGRPRWLASIIARATDRRIQAVLARQLNAELGNGVVCDAPLTGLDELLAEIEGMIGAGIQHRTPGDAGRRVLQRAEECFGAADVDACLGAMIAIEIRGLELSLWLSGVIAAAPGGGRPWEWPETRAEVEAAHAADGYRLSELLETEARQRAALGGVRAIDRALWGFLDQLDAASGGGP